jgi:hypothetical protein
MGEAKQRSSSLQGLPQAEATCGIASDHFWGSTVGSEIQSVLSRDHYLLTTERALRLFESDRPERYAE